MEIPQEVVEALRAGRKIEAIKRLRQARGIGLKEAKEAVEAWQAGHPELSAEPERQGSGRWLQALLIMAAFGWLLINLVDVAAAIIVLINRAEYRPAIFTVEKLQYHHSGGENLVWGFDGKIDDRAERYYAPSLADGEKLGLNGLRRLFPPGTEMEVWYNPEVTATLFQGRTLRVLPFTPDLVEVEVARLRWWVLYCLLPFALVVFWAGRNKRPKEKPEDRVGLPPSLGPS